MVQKGAAVLKREDKALPAGKAAAGPDADNKSAPAAALRWLAAKAIRAGTMPPAAPPAARAAAGWLGCRRQQVQQGVCGGSSVGGRLWGVAPCTRRPTRPLQDHRRPSATTPSWGGREALGSRGRSFLDHRAQNHSGEPLGSPSGSVAPSWTTQPEWLSGG